MANDERVHEFLDRPLAGEWPYLWLDATYLKVRQGGRIISVAAIIAVAVNTDGRREIIGLTVGPSEAETFWSEFLRSLKGRGLDGVQLVISDAHTGLKAAIQRVFDATWQRCRVHWMRNALAHVPKGQHTVVAAAIRQAFNQPWLFVLRYKSSPSSSSSTSSSYWTEVADALRACLMLAMNRHQLERHQVWIYIAAILLGLATGTLATEIASAFETLLWPVLGLLLFITFTQVPLVHLPEAARDRRFIGAMLVGNFALVPIVVAALIVFVPDEPALRLGVLVVLLVPCTDWFISFTHLGRGDAVRATAATPILLLVQIALLPVFLWFFLGNAFLELLAADRIVAVFVTLILLPLVAAFVLERWATGRIEREAAVAPLGWLSVPLLAVVVFLISMSQVGAVRDALPVLAQVAGVFVAYLIAAALIGVATGRLAGLPAPARRTLIFSLGTRNSFVVLPLALALGPEWNTVAVVIVFQSLVELFGMVAYLCIVPRFLVPDHVVVNEEPSAP